MSADAYRSGDTRENQPLTGGEVASLRDGDRVAVTWPGGNGPHEYVVRVRTGTGTRWAFVTYESGDVAVAELEEAAEVRRLPDAAPQR